MSKSSLLVWRIRSDLAGIKISGYAQEPEKYCLGCLGLGHVHYIYRDITYTNH